MDWYSNEIEELIRRALAEDLGPGDATCLATVPAKGVARARIVAKAPLVCAGLPIAERVFRALDADVTLTLLAKDGEYVAKGREISKYVLLPVWTPLHR